MSKKALLMILDGWGLGDKSKADIISSTPTPFMDSLYANYPNSHLLASGEDVGLPQGQMGNSEVGHLNIGAGRVVFQDLVKINIACRDNSILENPAIVKAYSYARDNKKKIHFLGLVSDGGVHSHNSHLYALLQLAKQEGVENVFVHAFLDGRDVPPSSAADYLAELEAKLKEIGVGKIATISGRYYAMDRDKRWDRVQKAYNAIALGEGVKQASSELAIKNSYIEGANDEFMKPTVHENYTGMQDGDGLWMINFRADRVRQLLRGLLLHDFNLFNRKQIVKFGPTLAMNDYAEDLSPLIPSIFTKTKVEKSLGEIIADYGLKQMRVAETEKYAHVTFFLNGGREKPLEGEERVMIPSPNVATYDLQPEMSAQKVTETVCAAMERDDLSLIVIYRG